MEGLRSWVPNSSPISTDDGSPCALIKSYFLGGSQIFGLSVLQPALANSSKSALAQEVDEFAILRGHPYIRRCRGIEKSPGMVLKDAQMAVVESLSTRVKSKTLRANNAAISLAQVKWYMPEINKDWPYQVSLDRYRKL